MPKELPLVVQWRKAFLSSSGPEKGTTRAVLLYLSTEMRADGTRCFPSQVRIAEALSVSTRTVERAIADARELGWLRVIKRDGRAPGSVRRSGGKHSIYFPEFANEYLATQSREVQEEKSPTAPENPTSPPVTESGGKQRPATWSQRPDTGSQPPDPPSQSPDTESAYLVGTRLVLGSDQIGDASISEEDPPDGWTVPAEFRDYRRLFDLMGVEEKRWAHVQIDGAPTVAISSARDLALLPPASLRQLQFRMAHESGSFEGG
jgi:hypothetical protein